MSDRLENIEKGILHYYPVSEASMNLLKSYFVPCRFAKKELIIRRGVRDRHVYFIEQGFARSYCVVGDKEVTTWFSREGDITFALMDLYRDKAGFEFVEAVEDMLTYKIRITDLNRVYAQNIELANWSRVVHQECLLQLQLSRIDGLHQSATDRYFKLLEQFPDLFERVNLIHIASFLGITPQFLSRLRHKIQPSNQNNWEKDF